MKQAVIQVDRTGQVFRLMIDGKRVKDPSGFEVTGKRTKAKGITELSVTIKDSHGKKIEYSPLELVIDINS